MRYLLLALSLVIPATLTPPTRAQDELKAVLEKAVKAHGGKDNLAKVHAISSKSTGKIELYGGLDFSQESISDLPRQFKETLDVETNGTRFRTTTVIVDGKGWTTNNSDTTDLDATTLEELKQAINLMELGTLRFVDNKEFLLTPLGSSTLDNKPVFGIKVARKGYRDAKLFFSKDTGLLVKIERQAYDPVSMHDVIEERVILEYQEVNGIKVAKEIVVRRGGKKFMKAEISEFKLLDKVDPAEFARPEK
jgi:hypothetical protein